MNRDNLNIDNDYEDDEPPRLWQMFLGLAVMAAVIVALAYVVLRG